MMVEAKPTPEKIKSEYKYRSVAMSERAGMPVESDSSAVTRATV
jgi:hypothetical protein